MSKTSPGPASVLITGASSGIGQALALEYAAPGRHLVLVGRNADRLDDVARAARQKGATVAIGAIDVRDRIALADFITAIDRETPIDLAIANAGVTGGIGRDRPFETPEAVRALLAVNLVGVLNTLEPLLEPMSRRRAGRVAVVGSISGLKGMLYSPAYCAAKSAVHAWADAMRGSLARFGVGVTLIVPGFVTTPLNADLECPKPFAMPPERAARIIRRGLDRGRAVVAFPRLIVFATALLRYLPRGIVDRVMASIEVEITETTDRVVEWTGRPSSEA